MLIDKILELQNDYDISDADMLAYINNFAEADANLKALLSKALDEIEQNERNVLLNNKYDYSDNDGILAEDYLLDEYYDEDYSLLDDEDIF